MFKQTTGVYSIAWDEVTGIIEPLYIFEPGFNADKYGTVCTEHSSKMKFVHP